MVGLDISAIVLCEGKEDKQVLECLLADMGIDQVEVRKYEGKDNLRQALKLLIKSPEFTRGQYTRILVTRDADEDWDSAWASMRDTIQNVFKIQLNDAIEWVPINEDTQITAWVFPGHGQKGMIETLCLDVARQTNPEAFECLDQYTDCLQQKYQARLLTVYFTAPKAAKTEFLWRISVWGKPTRRRRSSCQVRGRGESSRSM